MSRTVDLTRGVSTLADALYRVRATGKLFIPTSFRALALLTAFFSNPAFAADVLTTLLGRAVDVAQAAGFTARYIAEHGGVGVTSGDAAEKGIGVVWTYVPNLSDDAPAIDDDSWDDIFSEDEYASDEAIAE